MDNLMQLKILLPHRIFLEKDGIKHVQVETASGSYGFLPQRLDCVAPLPPGLLTYTGQDGKDHYVAVDQGIFVKAGQTVSVAVRNAIGGTDLGELHKRVDEEFRNLDDEEQEVRRVMSHLETGFVRSFEKLINQ